MENLQIGTTMIVRGEWIDKHSPGRSLNEASMYSALKIKGIIDCGCDAEGTAVLCHYGPPGAKTNYNCLPEYEGELAASISPAP